MALDRVAHPAIDEEIAVDEGRVVTCGDREPDDGAATDRARPARLDRDPLGRTPPG